METIGIKTNIYNLVIKKYAGFKIHLIIMHNITTRYYSLYSSQNKFDILLLNSFSTPIAEIYIYFEV